MRFCEYRDVDGSKVHQAVRETYGTAYVEGDVIGFYINLPNGAEYAPKYELYVNKTNRTVFPVPVEKNEGPPKRVPGMTFGDIMLYILIQVTYHRFSSYNYLVG